MPQSISRDVPLNEITLRRYEKPYDMPKRELIRKLCLSLGVLQPGDSRDIIVDILHALINAREHKTLLNAETIQEHVILLRTNANLPKKGIALSNIRRQLKRLRDISLAEKIKSDYRITEFHDLATIFDTHLTKYYLDTILTRVREYCTALK